jgi:hypothetical protein
LAAAALCLGGINFTAPPNQSQNESSLLSVIVRPKSKPFSRFPSFGGGLRSWPCAGTHPFVKTAASGYRRSRVDRFSLMGKRQIFCAEGNDMPVITGFDKLASVPEEQITDKIRRRVVSGKQGTMVYWRMKAGAHAAAHKHPHVVWMVKGTMDYRIGNEKRTMKRRRRRGDSRRVEHEGYFPEDAEAVDFFAPVRDDFLTGALPSYMVQR